MCQKLGKIVIFATGELMGSFLFCLVPRCSRGDSDTSRCEKACHACDAGFAVDIATIVILEIEGDKRSACLRRASGQKLVKQPLPRPGMDRCRLRDHAIQIEDERIEAPHIYDNHGQYRRPLSRSTRRTIIGQEVSQITRCIVRARPGSSAPRQPRTMRSLCCAKSTMAAPASPWATARRISVPPLAPPTAHRRARNSCAHAGHSCWG